MTTDILDKINGVLDEFIERDGGSPDADDTEADDLDDEPRQTGEHLIARCDIDLGYPIYPDDELGRDHHGCPVWGLFAVVSEADGDWWPELVVGGGMTLAEARMLAEEMGVTLLG